MPDWGTGFAWIEGLFRLFIANLPNGARITKMHDTMRFVYVHINPSTQPFFLLVPKSILADCEEHVL